MGDAPTSEMDSNKVSLGSENPSDVDRRPFGGLEFQVSEVVERLEAGVNAQDAMEEEKKPEERKISTGFFEPEKMDMDEILKVLEQLVLQTDPSCESLEPPLLPTDSVTRAAILSHSISALFSRLERSHAARLGTHIATETTRWMAHLFRLSDYDAFYHQEQLEGLVRVTRMLLHHKYPRYLEDGALAFSNRLPSIYSCVASPLGVVQHLCRQLGLPLACVRPVPVDASGKGMDLNALDRLCEEDSAGRTPLLVLGEAGEPPLGGGSPLKALAELCGRRGVHLHVRGHALALPAAGGFEQTYSIADSLTLQPGPWFGIPGLPTVTFYKIPEPLTANDHSKVVNSASSREGALAALGGLTAGAARLAALPLWTATRAAGAKRLARRIDAAFRSARTARALIASTELRLLSDRPGGDEPPNMDIVDAISESSACVSFQFAPAGCADRPPPYYDKLNSWLGQVLQREADMINIEICETESYGVVLRYCPLEGIFLEEDRLSEWAAVLDAQLHVLTATVALREPFQKTLQTHPCLRLVHVPGWAGLGGVRYVPPGWENAPLEELNSLNRQLVETLRATDGAFSCGDGEDGMACVRFGMVTADTDVDELLDLVLSAGKDVEENSKALTDMTEVLKKGISAAQEELNRSAWQEGLLRRVPVVGRVVSWWAPPQPCPGRRLLLTHGTLQATDDIYRFVQKKDKEEPARAHSPTRQNTVP
ncbi:pyridoxal-dependent decarboxylase domain-containing protein 1 [Danaus plexippus]|uniref:pyridoxal-dependent decarboxylase domain-containing protein 1 n=1 Tax=Danaus plexippus TaxID=13037 RepID=UPI002AAFDABF|nr:pyridoxal-dependent decarboxylase domain-containing protein 1 [Danaus plexippus]